LCVNGTVELEQKHSGNDKCVTEDGEVSWAGLDNILGGLKLVEIGQTDRRQSNKPQEDADKVVGPDAFLEESQHHIGRSWGHRQTEKDDGVAKHVERGGHEVDERAGQVRVLKDSLAVLAEEGEDADGLATKHGTGEAKWQPERNPGAVEVRPLEKQ